MNNSIENVEIFHKCDDSHFDEAHCHDDDEIDNFKPPLCISDNRTSKKN